METHNTPVIKPAHKKSGKIIGVIAEVHPQYAYLTEYPTGFEAGDIVTTCLEDPAPDREMYIVNEILNEYSFSLNRKVPIAMNRWVRKIGTIADIENARIGTPEYQNEQNVRTMMRELYLTEELKGTIEDRLLEGYLYTISHEDMTLTPEERKQQRIEIPGQRTVNVHTGKAGILQYISTCRRNGLPEQQIAETIWIELVIEGVRLHVCIKNLKVNEKNTTKEQAGESEVDTHEQGREQSEEGNPSPEATD